jgi:Flp pilus assembly protein TadB
MSKERARRRAAREHEAGLKAAARAAEQERRERREARKQSLRTAGGLIRPAAPGRPVGALAERRRKQNLALAAVLLAVVVLVWVVWPVWAARLGIIVLVVLAFPVLRLLLFSRR